MNTADRETLEAKYPKWSERFPKIEKPEPGVFDTIGKLGKNVVGMATATLGDMLGGYRQQEVAEYEQFQKEHPDSMLAQSLLKEAKNSRDNALNLSESAQKFAQAGEMNPKYRNRGIADLMTDWKFLTDSNGFLAGATRGIGSTLPQLALGGGIAGAAKSSIKPLSALGNKVFKSNSAVSNLFSEGSRLGKIGRAFDETLGKGLVYAGTGAPMDATTNAAELIRPLKERGFSDQDIAKLMNMSVTEELPVDFLDNIITGGTILGKGFGLAGKTRKGILGYGALNLPIEAGSEYLQEGYQTRTTRKYMGLPYTESPISKNLFSSKSTFEQPEERDAAVEGGIGGFGMSGAGTVVNVIRGKGEDYDDSSKENKPSNASEITAWAKNISKNKNADHAIEQILKEAEKNQLTPEQTKFVLALATAESNFNQKAVSPVGAIGVMQLMPETAKGLGVNANNPKENIEGGVKLLKQLLDKFDGDMTLAAAAYNAGEGAVQRYGGVPPYEETQKYVERINNLLADAPEYKGGISTKNVLGVEDYHMPTQGESITEQVNQLKSGWSSVLPQIGGALKDKFGISATISSGGRTAEHNAEDGGVPTSHHIIRENGGDAVDIVFDKDVTAEEQNRIAEYFKSTGLFGEVLYHDVGSGVHLHLGNLNIDAFKNFTKNNQNTKFNTISEEDSNDAENYAVDKIIMDLLNKGIEPTSKLDFEKETPLTKSVYIDFVNDAKSTLKDDELAEFEKLTKDMFKKNGEFINSKANRDFLKTEYGEQLQEFGQKLLSDRIKNITQIQSPNRLVNDLDAVKSEIRKLIEKDVSENNPAYLQKEAALQANDKEAMLEILKDAGVNLYQRKRKSSQEKITSEEVQPTTQSFSREKQISQATRMLANYSERLDNLQKEQTESLQRLQTARSLGDYAVVAKEARNQTNLVSQIEDTTAALSKLQKLAAASELENNITNLNDKSAEILERAATAYQNRQKATNYKEFVDTTNKRIETARELENESLSKLAGQFNTDRAALTQQAVKLYNRIRADRTAGNDRAAEYNSQRLKQVAEQISEIDAAMKGTRGLVEEWAKTQPPTISDLEQEIRVLEQNADTAFQNSQKAESPEMVASEMKKVGIISDQITARHKELIKLQERQNQNNQLTEDQKNIQDFVKLREESQELKRQLQNAEENLVKAKTSNNDRNIRVAVVRRNELLKQQAELKARLNELQKNIPLDLFERIPPLKISEATTAVEKLNEEIDDLKRQLKEARHDFSVAESINDGDRKGRARSAVDSLLNQLNAKIAERDRLMSEFDLTKELKVGNHAANQKAQHLSNAGVTIKEFEQQNAKSGQNLKGLTGDSVKISTDKGNEIVTRYRIVEVENIISSHKIGDNDMVYTNEKYPQELQPRKREDRISMQQQAVSMSNNLRSEDLMESRNVNQGAPIVRGDGVVLNGNGRTMAISRAYDKGNADNYRDFLISNAANFGFKSEEVAKVKKPILVREIVHDLNAEELKDVTQSTVGGVRYGASEQAEIDAQKITQATLNLYVANDDGDLTTKDNRDFVNHVLKDILDSNEINACTDKDGKINADGFIRVKRALFAAAYEDEQIISQMAESTDNNIKNIINALTSAAPEMASIQKEMKNGNLYKYDIAENISAAIKNLSALRDEGKSVEEYLQEQNFDFAEDDSSETREILLFMDKNKRSTNKIARFFMDIAEKIRAQGNPKQGKLFGRDSEEMSLSEIIQAAKGFENTKKAPDTAEVVGRSDNKTREITDEFLSGKFKDYINTLEGKTYQESYRETLSEVIERDGIKATRRKHVERILKDNPEVDGNEFEKKSEKAYLEYLRDGVSTETKKVANKGEQDTSTAQLAEGYKTESGRSLQDADRDEFIIKPDGSKDFGEIKKSVVDEANKNLEQENEKVRLEVAPVRLKVGHKGRGFIHLHKHTLQMKDKGFSPIEYVNHILKNFNQIYYQPQNGERRFVLYSKGDNSKGFMPLDLELVESGGNYYEIVSVMVHSPNIKGKLVFDGGANPSTATADSALNSENNDKGGVATSPTTNTKTDNPSAETIPQTEEGSKEFSKTDNDELREKIYKKLQADKYPIVKDYVNKASDDTLQILNKKDFTDKSIARGALSHLKNSFLDKLQNGYLTSVPQKTQNKIFQKEQDLSYQIEAAEISGKEAYKQFEKFLQRTLGVKSETSTEETKKAAIKVTGDEFGEYSDINELRQKAIQYYKDNLQGTSVENKILGKIDIDENGLIEFTTSGRKKLQTTSRENKKLFTIKYLRELLQSATNARNVESKKEKHNRESFVYMDNEIESDGEILPVHITLVKRNNGDTQFYNFNFIENERYAGKPARPESSNEALGTLPVSVSSAENISQKGEVDNKSREVTDEILSSKFKDYINTLEGETYQESYRETLSEVIERDGIKATRRKHVERILKDNPEVDGNEFEKKSEKAYLEYLRDGVSNETKKIANKGEQGTLLFDRSASLSSTSNSGAAQNGNADKNVGIDTQSATEKAIVPSGQTISQTQNNDNTENESLREKVFGLVDNLFVLKITEQNLTQEKIANAVRRAIGKENYLKVEPLVKKAIDFYSRASAAEMYITRAAKHKKSQNQRMVEVYKEMLLEELENQTKKAATKGEQDTSEAKLPQGYKTESGLNLNEAVPWEFIIKPDGSKDFGEIDENIIDKANSELEKMNNNFRLKNAPIRLQVGMEDTGESDGFGYKHILNHLDDIKNRGFENIPSYVEHILKNFNQIYKSSLEENRIILYCKGDKSKGLMPLDLELEKGEDNFYTIVSAYPRRRVKKEETLLVDVRPTNTPTDTASVPHLQDSNDKSGVASQRDIAKSNISSAESVPQSAESGKGVNPFEEADNLPEKFKTEHYQKAYSEMQDAWSKYKNGELDSRELLNTAQKIISDYQKNSDHYTEEYIRGFDSLSSIEDKFEDEHYSPENQAKDNQAWEDFLKLRDKFSNMHDEGKISDKDYASKDKKISSLATQVQRQKITASKAYEKLKDIIGEETGDTENVSSAENISLNEDSSKKEVLITNAKTNSHTKTSSKAKLLNDIKTMGIEDLMKIFGGNEILNMGEVDRGLHSGELQKLTDQLDVDKNGYVVSKNGKQKSVASTESDEHNYDSENSTQKQSPIEDSDNKKTLSNVTDEGNGSNGTTADTPMLTRRAEEDNVSAEVISQSENQGKAEFDGEIKKLLKTAGLENKFATKEMSRKAQVRIYKFPDRDVFNVSIQGGLVDNYGHQPDYKLQRKIDNFLIPINKLAELLNGKGNDYTVQYDFEYPSDAKKFAEAVNLYLNNGKEISDKVTGKEKELAQEEHNYRLYKKDGKDIPVEDILKRWQVNKIEESEPNAKTQTSQEEKSETKKAATKVTSDDTFHSGETESKSDDEITTRSKNILKELGLENLSPNKGDSLGKTYGRMEGDGTFTVNFGNEIEDTQKLKAVKQIAEKLGGEYNSDDATFKFRNIEDVATFFKAVRTAFYGKRDKISAKSKKFSNATDIELPEGYKTETGKTLEDSSVGDFVVDDRGNKNFGEITSDIEKQTNGIVKSAPIRLQVGNGDFGYIHITTKHLDEIQNKGYSDAISYIKKILDNVNKIYSRADIGSLDRFILCSEGVKGKSKDFMPIDLELEKGEEDYYKIITAYPNSNKKIEGLLIFDDSTHSSSVTATDSLIQLADDKSGVSYQGANAKTDNPSAETIPQNQVSGKENSNIADKTEEEKINEREEMGESGSVDGRHQVRESELREGIEEGVGREGRDSVFEGDSGQERRVQGRDVSADIGENAESDRPVAENETGERGKNDRAGIRAGGDSPTVYAGVKSNYHIEDESGIGEGGEKTKYRQNVDAIKLLKKIESENRLATPEEQKVLAKFNGWGSVASVFTDNENWKKEYAELKELLTTEEYDAAKAAMTNAFYTDPKIAREIWKGLEKLGFKGGRILDPSMGTGIFFGTMPQEIAGNSTLRGVELDNLSGRIAKQLYQDAWIDNAGFETLNRSDMPNNYYDLAISNVPFADVKILSDPDYESKKYSLHNFFFAKAMDKVRKGGLVAFITSTGTMQSRGGEAKRLRAEIASKADLIAAVKLPNNTFDKNAGTQVTTDIIILQKREDPLKPSPHAKDWNIVESMSVDDDVVAVNEYFKKNPKQMIGKPTLDKLYAGNPRLALNGKGIEVVKRFGELLKKLPGDIYQAVKRKVQDAAKDMREILTDSHALDKSLIVQNGVAYQIQDGKVVEVGKTDQQRVKDYIVLREMVDNLLTRQLDPRFSDERLMPIRRELGEIYDEFVKKYGWLNAKNNILKLGSDPNFGRVAAIEDYREEKVGNGNKKIETVHKTDIFFKRTVGAISEPTSAENPHEALMTSLSVRGGVDLEYIAKLLGRKTYTEVLDDIGDLVYRNPNNSGTPYVYAGDYLSGNVREKLAIAKEAARYMPEFNRNVEALEKIQPIDYNEHQIAVHIGAPWIPSEIYEDFAEYMISDPNVKVTRYMTQNQSYDQWGVSGENNSEKNFSTWGVGKKYSFLKLLEAELNGKTITVTYKDDEQKTHVDEIKTAEVNAKREQIREEFEKWLWRDDKRKKYLLRLFNDQFNNYVAPNYDASFLKPQGLNASIELRPHQKNVIWRTMQGKNTLIAHAVGAGKTLEMIVSAMEMKRLGIIRKPLMVVPNNIVSQFEKDFRNAYPSSKVLVLQSSDLPGVRFNFDFRDDVDTKEHKDSETTAATKWNNSEEKESERQARLAKRRRTLSTIATGDFDGIIISQELFKNLPLSSETYNEFIREQISELEMARNAANGLPEDTFVAVRSKREEKLMQKAIENLKQRLTRDIKQEKKEIVIPFEELGIDQIFVDEADMFKNLGFRTSKGRVSGISTANSQRALDLYMKTRWLTKQRNGGGVVFATGTPISNTLNEMFTMMRYLFSDYLAQNKMRTFDSWAKMFAKEVPSVELKPDGSGYRVVTKLKFKNLATLGQIFRQFADVLLTEDLKIEKPSLKNGEYTKSIIKPTKTFTEYKQKCVERAEAIHRGDVDRSEDNMLKLTSDLRKASLDMRLIDPTIPESEAGSKISKVCDNVTQKYKETTEVKGAQLVFLDIGTPKPKKDETQENSAEEDAVNAETSVEDIAVYDRIKTGLIERGIPAKQIAFAHDAKSAKARKNLFDKVNDGEIRVIIGSTAKMGAGVNFQKHLVALHHVDCAWRPRDIEQREGRILRNGNENKEVEIFTYVVEGSYDANMWSKVAAKQSMINSVLRNDNTIDNTTEFEDSDATTMSYQEMMAIGSGNPLLLKLVDLQSKVNRLKNLQKAHFSRQTENKKRLDDMTRENSMLEPLIERTRKDISERTDTKKDKFKIKIGDKIFTKPSDAQVALDQLKKNFDGFFSKKIGEIGGFDISMQKEGNEYRVTLENNGTYNVNTTSVIGIRNTVENAPDFC